MKKAEPIGNSWLCKTTHSSQRTRHFARTRRVAQEARWDRAPLLVLEWQDGRYLVGIPQPAARKPGPGQEVVLLIDEGVHFFRFRAIYIRGQMEPAEELREAPAGQTWFEMVPLQTVTWDYGTLHKVREEA